MPREEKKSAVEEVRQLRTFLAVVLLLVCVGVVFFFLVFQAHKEQKRQGEFLDDILAPSPTMRSR
jgi:hypothetical protein